MLKHLMNTTAVRMAGFAIAIGLVTAVVSIPVGAAEDEVARMKELKHLVANAEKPADHERIAKFFDAEAAKYEAESQTHGELAPARCRPAPGIWENMAAAERLSPTVRAFRPGQAGEVPVARLWQFPAHARAQLS